MPVAYPCPVCGFPQMPYPPANYDICPCCGTEFGLDDVAVSHGELRDEWLQNGAPWFSAVKPYLRPERWNAWDQLDAADLRYSVPRPPSQESVKTQQLSIPGEPITVWPNAVMQARWNTGNA